MLTYKTKVKLQTLTSLIVEMVCKLSLFGDFQELFQQRVQNAPVWFTQSVTWSA